MIEVSILMFCPQFRPVIGGAERQAEKLAKALVRKGIKVVVLTPRLTSDAALFEDDSGVAIHRFPLFDLSRCLPGLRGIGPLNLILIRLQVIGVVRKYLKGIDLLHTHIASPLTAFAMQAAKKQGIPVLCKVANAGPPNDIDRVLSVGWGGRLIAHSLLAYMDCWVATTSAVFDSLIESRIQSEKIAKIPNGVDLGIARDDDEIFGAAQRFLYLGRISTGIERDLPTLIQAFERVAARFPAAELALVGDGDLFKQTAALVAASPYSNRIRMPGMQVPEPWLKWADCFVLPSRREGLSNALLEAMSHGLACIANDIPPNREVLADGKAGVLVPIGDKNRLYEAMLSMVNNTEYARTLRKAALKRIRNHYAIASVADRYIALYEKLIWNSSQ